MAQGLDPLIGNRILSFPKRADLLLRPPSLLLNGYRVLSRW